MESLLIIHSLDSTTEFLNEIKSFIERSGFKNISNIHLEDANVEPNEIRTRISALPFGGTVIFLGHGASHCIYMPIDELTQVKQPLLQADHFHFFENRNFVSLSCRSADFINRNFLADGKSTMIGFDDLPTHWEDIQATREVDVNAYPKMSDSVLEHFRSILVEIFKLALWDSISREENFSFFYYRLKLYTNLYISKVHTEKISDLPSVLASILYDFKVGIRIFGARNRRIFTK